MVVVTGEITGVMNWTSNFVYVLRGAVFVKDGGVLNIEAGTLVAGEAGSVGALIVERGGKLNALGTRERPIVFTSDQPPGTRFRGDWGGLIINGRAPTNIPGGEGVGEANTGIYGGDDPDDDSGTLRYVRVEFAGSEFSPDNELNGIAFQGVGRGGRYEYIQVHMNRDDAFEWFGGTADIKYAIASNTGDDSFDWTFGWTGRAQFLAVHQRSDDADWAIEADNNEFNNNLLPRAARRSTTGPAAATDGNEGAEGFRPCLPPRHGRDLPQLPDRRVAHARPADRRCRHPRAGGQRHHADRLGCHLGLGDAAPLRHPALRRERPVPERPRQRRRRAVARLLQPRARTSSRCRWRPWPAASWPRSSRPTTASSSR